MDLGTVVDSDLMGLGKLTNPLGHYTGKSALINIEGMEDSINNMNLRSTISFDRPLSTPKTTKPFKLSGITLPLFTVMYRVNRLIQRKPKSFDMTL